MPSPGSTGSAKSPGPSASVPSLGATIEITSPDASRMRIHLEPGRGLETAVIVATFLGGRG